MVKPTDFDWTEDADATLKRMFVDQGCSGTEIAHALDPSRKLSRNAVLGRAFRMGLKRRSSNETKAIETAIMRRRKRKAPHPMTTWVVLAAPIRPEGAKTLMQLGKDECRWPVTETPIYKADDLRFCGAPKLPGFPYCAHCLAKAYRQPSETERREIKRARTIA